MNNLKVGLKFIVDGGCQTWRICRRLSVITFHSCFETAECIRGIIEKYLFKKTGLKLNDFRKTFTFVTDWALVTAKTSGASISSQNVLFLELWVGCIIHQLDTVMKNVSESELIRSLEF